MNFPFTISNRHPNNIIMKEDALPYDLDLAFSQWLAVYRRLSQDALIYLLPSEYEFQDLPFVSNVGAYLPHRKNIIIISNFNSIPRRGEEFIAKTLFQSMRYQIFRPHDFWEGEADLKYIRENIYVGGYGIRTQIEAYRWMEAAFGMKVISIQMTDPKFFHLDCFFFPMSETRALIHRQAVSREDLNKLEKYMEIIEVPEQYVYNDCWTNSIRLGNKVFGAVKFPNEFAAFLDKYNLELINLDISEFEKSGAGLSCLCMRLNHISYK